MVAIKQTRDKTYDDYLALPEGVKAELIDGELYMSPQPKGRHIRFSSVVGGQLTVRMGMADGPTSDGPGGWWILDEPECHLQLDRRVVVPDLAGWRVERMPKPPDDNHKFTLVPDWVCEVLSPSTRNYDYLVKSPKYRQAGVQWLWVVDPQEQRVGVFRNDGEEWLEVGTFEGPGRFAVPPFEAIELDLTRAWTS